MFKQIIIFSLLLLLISPFVSAQSSKEYKEKIREEKQYLLESYKNKLNEQKAKFMEQKENFQQEKKQELQEKKEQVRNRICEGIEERIDEKVGKFDQTKEAHVEKYQKLKERMAEIVSAMGEKGYDVAELKEDLLVLDEMVQDYAQAYSDFIESLRFTRGYACGESDGDFKDNLKASKEYFDVVKEIRAEIRDFYTGVLRGHIRNLRQQYQDKMSDNTDGKSDSTQVENEEE